MTRAVIGGGAARRFAVHRARYASTGGFMADGGARKAGAIIVRGASSTCVSRVIAPGHPKFGAIGVRETPYACVRARIAQRLGQCAMGIARALYAPSFHTTLGTRRAPVVVERCVTRVGRSVGRIGMPIVRGCIGWRVGDGHAVLAGAGEALGAQLVRACREQKRGEREELGKKRFVSVCIQWCFRWSA